MSSNNPWKEESELTPTQSPQKSTISNTSINSNSSTPHTKKSSSTTSNGELRPLRLSKQRSSTSSSNSTPTVSSFSNNQISPSRKSSLPNNNNQSTDDGFQCRPMRLGSNRNNSDPSETFTRKNSESTQSSSLQRKKSIQIKNLPINKRNSIISNHSSIDSNNKYDDMIFAICLVDFHHQRGPEIQWWKSNYHQEYSPNLFKNLSFQALPDGSHLFEETFSNFNLIYDFNEKISIDDLNEINDFKGDPRNLKTLFGCSCVHQLKTSELDNEEKQRNKDITRSIVQKAVVVIVRKQPIFTKIKEKLSIITKSYFLQQKFNDYEILEHLFDNLNNQYKLVDNELQINEIEEEENYINLNLRSSLLKFKLDYMIIFKALLLEKKILIYSNNNLETLTQFQNNLISLIPNLINNLDDSGCPLIDYIETNGPLDKPQSLNTNNRLSMLRFYGLPLQIFNTKNSFWNPYLPLQQLNELKINSFMIGCSNLLFVNQATTYGIDLLINLDSNEISYPKTISQPDYLTLSNLDKKFINNLINSTNLKDEFLGNDDYIRYQFEEYLNSLISTIRFWQYKEKFNQSPPGFTNSSYGNLQDFNKIYIDNWVKTQNFKIWNLMCDDMIFNFIEPKHIGHSLINQPISINKNISNFFNNFKFQKQNLEVDDENIKSHKFIEKENNNDITNDVNDNESVDELVEGFEKVNSSTDDNSFKSNQTQNSWSNWAFKKK
ncbi:uncharacterized protein KGF55_005031 [Candida pseudojiufengensis]|uniref:uncharacterized protein n=1 Tax=Candida pseudojiufengensis TaxID=497109 RepID=UPI0022243765|nr:uncharacterized protein KGF55_005031 [Candida pseudojiufengensis]KAI5959799.1 hypothetical protein KGF55_005031 [Candida pseudojiufengensis]